MGILILSTNLNSASCVEKVSRSFNEHQKIVRWSVDFEDCDNVMRIVAEDGFAEKEAIEMIVANGFSGADLNW